MGAKASECQRCHKRRTTKLITGGNLPEKALELCRPCTRGAKLAHKMIEHVHVWNNVPMSLGSPPSMLTVQTCECGAVRKYLGPAYGYVKVKR